MMADRIDGVASAIRQAAGELSSQQQPTIAGYVEDVAEAVSGFSNTVRDRDVVDLAHDAEDLARHNPGLFLAGSVLVGFAAARFFRAVADSPRRETGTRSEEHTSELQSLMRISYAVFCLK